MIKWLVLLMVIKITPPKLTGYQKDFIYSDKRFTTVEASTKTGKTFSHIYWLFACAHANKELQAKKLNPHLSIAKEGNEYWWCAPVYAQSQIAFNRTKRKVSLNPNYTINKSDLTITTPLDTVLRFKTAKDPDNLYGEDVYAAVMDEYTRMKAESWYALRSTLTATKAPCKFIGNFKGKSNWGHQLSLKANQEDSEYERFKITAYDAIAAGILDREEVEQARKDLPQFMFNALYLAEGDIDEARLVDDDAIQDLLTNDFVKQGQKYLTADIAFQGSDKFVVWIWNGWRVIGLHVVDKSSPNEVEQIIKGLATKYGVPQRNIAYDADGVGSFLKGYLKNAKEFHNNGSPLKVRGKTQDYSKLKDQCYFGIAMKINASEIYFEADVSDYWNEIVEELECIKNRAFGTDGKLEVLRKKEVKEIIGRSPDFSDALMMRYYFEVGTVKKFGVAGV
ncbi:hypothetical protein [Ekhidna sp.]